MQSSSTASAIVPIVERYKAVTPIAEAFNLAEPAIATLAKERGLEKVQKAFRLQFARFAADLHIKDTLNESDIDFIVEALTTDDNYKWLKTADIAILFKRIRMNKYGKLYQAMNTGTFFECLDKYCIERNGEIERIRGEEAKGHRSDLIDAEKTVLSYFIYKGVTYQKDEYYVDESGEVCKKDVVEKPKEQPKKDNSERVRMVVNTAKAMMQADPSLDYARAIQEAEYRINHANNE